MNWQEKEVLITGGTGSLGKTLTRILCEKKPRGIRIFSRDELKQWEMKKAFGDLPISFLLGDVRDQKRLHLACKGVNILIHAAALKQVIAGEDNPMETIKTNIIGSQNVLYSALENKIERVIGISSDKACYPINLYGATKLCMERLFIQGNEYSGGRNPRFSICRYGNVIGSRGSVIPLFKEQAKTGKLTVTDPKATRFWITLEEVARFIIQVLETMNGGEIFVPKMKSCNMQKIAEAVAPEAVIVETGLLVGEKKHETLITEEEMKRTSTKEDHFIIHPEDTHPIDTQLFPFQVLAPEGYRYSSFYNLFQIETEDIKRFL